MHLHSSTCCSVYSSMTRNCLKVWLYAFSFCVACLQRKKLLLCRLCLRRIKIADSVSSDHGFQTPTYRDELCPTVKSSMRSGESSRAVPHGLVPFCVAMLSDRKDRVSSCRTAVRDMRLSVQELQTSEKRPRMRRRR